MTFGAINALRVANLFLCLVLTLTSIACADLSDYPKQLTSSSGDFEGEIVFSNPEDAPSASDILAGLEASEAGTAEEERSPTYKYKDIQMGVDLNNSAAFGTEGIDASTVKSLWDGEVTIDTNEFKKSYDTHEEILLRGLSVETGLSFLGREDEDFKERVFLAVPKNGIKYYYKFDDVLDTNNFLTRATTSNPIHLPMLGRTMRIIGATANSITVSSGEFFTLSVGQTAEYQGHKITLMGADASSATFKVDEEEVWITELYSKDVGSIDIYLEKVHDMQDSPDDVVEIWVSGSKSKAIYKDDDPFIGEPTVGARWRWELGALNTAYPSINASWSLIADEADEVFYEGQPIRLINSEFDWLEITLTRVLRDRRIIIKIDTSAEDLYTTEDDNAEAFATSAHVIHFQCVGKTSQKTLNMTVGQTVEFEGKVVNMTGTILPGVVYATFSVDGTRETIRESENAGVEGVTITVNKIYESEGVAQTTLSGAQGCNTGNTFNVNGHYSDSAYLYRWPDGASISSFYKDTDGRIVFAKNESHSLSAGPTFGVMFNIEYIDTVLPVNVSNQYYNPGVGTTYYHNITFNETYGYTGDKRNLKLITEEEPYAIRSCSHCFKYLGHSDGDTTIKNDWTYQIDNLNTGKDVSGWEENTRTDAGIVLRAPRDTDAEDVYYLEVPAAITDFKARVAIRGSGAKVGQGVSIKGVKSSSLKDNTKSASKATKNLVLVGGPCVNELSAEALKLKFPACGEDSGLKEGEAKIQLIEDAFSDGKNAILVYGWSTEDTKRAAEYLAKYWEQASFKGNEISV